MGAGMTEEIVALCIAMGATDSQRELVIPMAEIMIAGLTDRLKKGVKAEDCGRALPMAAALLVMDILGDGGGVTAFTAGDVSIHTQSGAADPWSQAERLLAPWLERSFAFRGVRG